MKSVKCPGCGFVGWADAEFCKKCGSSLMAPGPEAYYQAAPGTMSYQAGGFQPPLKKGLAIASLVLGIANFCLLGIFGITIVVGVILAVVALRKIKQQPLVYGGREFAIAGLVTNLVSVTILVPLGIIAAIAIPNLLAARRAANEGSAIYALRAIHNGEATYHSMHEKYGTLDQLAAERLITPDIAAGVRHGYKFRLAISTSTYSGGPGFEVVGIPAEYPMSGRRSFFVDETGVIRGADSNGGEATKYDPPLNGDSDYPSRPRTSPRYARDGSD